MVGDLILSFQQTHVSDVGDFRNRVALTRPGSRVTLSIIRNGKPRDVSVIIGNLDKATSVAESAIESADELGIIVQTITPELAQQYDVKPGAGVIITEVKPASLAARAGIRTGFVILQVNQIAVNTAREFTQAVKQSVHQKRVLLLLNDRGMHRYAVLSWR